MGEVRKLGVDDLHYGADTTSVGGVTITGLKPVDARFYGVVGDGTTDDTAAILAAYQAVSSTGGVLYFPAGSYLYTTRLELAGATGVTICGEGYNTNFVQSGDGYEPAFAGSTMTGVVIENLRITGMGSAFSDSYAGRGLIYYAGSDKSANYGAQDCIIRNVWINNSSMCGISLGYCDNVHVENVYITTTKEHGIYFSYTTNSTVRGAKIKLAGSGSTSQGVHSLKMVGSDNNAFFDLWAEDTLHEGITFETSDNNTFYGTHIFDPGQRCIRMVTGENIGNVFMGGFLSGAGTQTIREQAGATNNIYSGLYISSPNDAAYWGEDTSTGVNFYGNTVVGAPTNQYAIYQYGQNGLFTNNIVESTFTGGIVWTSTATGNRAFSNAFRNSDSTYTLVNEGNTTNIGQQVIGKGSVALADTLSDGSQLSDSCTVTGATYGDVVFVGTSLGVAEGCVLSGFINANNTVTVTLVNHRGTDFTFDFTATVIVYRM